MAFPSYNSKKATDVTAFFLSKTKNKTISKLKLMKLMYIAERNSIKNLGEPITFDSFYSLDHGPILSTTLDKINSRENDSYWNKHIQKINNKLIRLIKEPFFGYLNEDEIEILENVFTEHGHKSIQELIDLTHSYPEYKKPKGFRRRIQIFYVEVMKAVGLPEEEIELLKNHYSEAAKI